MKILVLNAGSSSQKSCLYEITDQPPHQPPQPLWEAQIDWTYQPGVAEIKVETHQSQQIKTLPFQERLPVIETLLSTLWSGDSPVISSAAEVDAVGHRVVHGGQHYHDSVRITPEVTAEIDRLSVLAPVHNPVNLEGIRAIETILGEQVPQVAVFDTAFHAQMPDQAAIYPIPYELSQQGIRRYGFHGTSHRYCAERTAEILEQPLSSLRIVTCHLGNGGSLAAIRNGRSVATTMGFTPLDGLMMGTRAGSIDPSILIYLIREAGYSADKLDQILNQASGLLGVSGVSNDMRQIDKAIAEGNPRARLAKAIYMHDLKAFIGAMVAVLGGLEALVFTAGVGENAPQVRAEACEAFGYMGLKLDLDQNNARPRDQVISTEDSTVKVLVVHTQEDWAIARDCWQVLQG
ncbi:MAG: acetate kinase [Pegethrix bostrychoides GSE-TBD4-15B]|jgi:acetate kinase|uniref:Acetate kinase n=1 Tax=Pegethrix bostrychoides GSE-TBD4-15B TaxID=2839662 RepID=A0A951U453_9CYAN|nr:acetate kinase [Pegethrix bostrychoides GSE-TBD4-15B]